MPVKHILTRGIGFSPGEVGYIVTHGYGALGGASPAAPAAAPYTITDALRVIESYLQKGGFVEFVEVGDPEALAQGSGIQARLVVRRRTDRLISLTVPQVSYFVAVTLYMNAFADAPDRTELRLADAVRDFVSDLLADWSLGGTVEWLDYDVQGPISAEWGYVNLAGTIYRVAQISVPILSQFIPAADLVDPGAFSSAWSAAFD